jgi:hypothetical protein
MKMIRHETVCNRYKPVVSGRFQKLIPHRVNTVVRGKEPFTRCGANCEEVGVLTKVVEAAQARRSLDVHALKRAKRGPICPATLKGSRYVIPRFAPRGQL